MGNFLGAAGLTRVWNKIAATYLKLSGGALSDNAVISRTGTSVTWVNGRNNPIIKTSSYTGYNAILSMKTTNGSWDLGVYSDDKAYLTYITDTNYGAGSNSTTYQLVFPKSNGTLALTSQIPTNNNQLTNGAGYIGIGSVRGNLSAWDANAMSWGTLTSSNGYTIGVHASSSDGGDWGMAYKGGQISMQLDGWFYQNEGQYRVLDTSDAGSLSVNYANSAGYASSAGDADTLDGYHAGHFGYMATYGQSDCNEVGPWLAAYRFDSTVYNAFYGASYGNMLCVGGGDRTDTEFQIGAPYNTQELYFRTGTWYGSGGTIRSASWNRIWHENNDGSGSGLDADLLDGNHASSFLFLSGGRTTGAITATTATPGSTTIDKVLDAIIIGPGQSRGTSSGIYYPGIGFNHMINYNNGTDYDFTTQAWIGLKLYDTPGSERSSLVFATKSGTDHERPVERASIDPFGNFYVTGAITAGSASDIRLKRDIQILEVEKTIDVLGRLNPITFSWNSKAIELNRELADAPREAGFIAQEVLEILPEAVRKDLYDKQYYRLDKDKLIAYLVKGWQIHEKEIKELKQKLK